MSAPDGRSEEAQEPEELEGPDEPEAEELEGSGGPEAEEPSGEITRLLEVLELAHEPESRLMVYRWESGRYAYLEALEASESPYELLDLIRSRHGPGKYQVRVVDTRNKYRGSRVVHLAPAEDAPARGDAAERPATDNRLDSLERAVERLVDRLAHAPPQPTGTPELLVESMRAQAQFQQLLMERLLADRSSDSSSGAELLEAFTRGMEMSQNRDGGSKLDTILASLVARVPPGAMSGPAGAAAPAPAPTAGENGGWDPLAELRKHLPMIRSAARVQLAAPTAAELVASALDGSPLMSWALEHADDLPTILVSLEPGLSEHVAWLEAVRDVLFPTAP